MTRSKIRTSGAEGLTLSSTSLTVANGLTLTDGDLTVASGHGINFAATSDASGMASELLDDYEEGTFTPTLLDGASASRTVSNASGRYRKIGDTVHIQANLTRDDTGGTNGNLSIGNLPFTSSNTPPVVIINGGMWADEGGPTTNNSDSAGIVYFPNSTNYVQGLKTTNASNQADYRYFRYEQITNGRPVYADCTFTTS
tara:strand:+ start:207 stop:803 length:597 start_codon:yes stop_codon:yes gene_type:complete